MRALFQASEERYFQIDAKINGDQADNEPSLSEKLCNEMNEWEKEDLER